MATVMTTADYFRLVEPALLSVFDGSYKQKPLQYKKVFATEEGEKAAYQEDVIMAELGFVPRKAEGGATTYDKMGIARVQRYETLEFGLGAAITRKARDDNRHIQVGKAIATQLGRSLRQTKEAQHASFLNQAFNAQYPLSDGKPLFATDHPLFEAGLTASNKLGVAADLSQASIEAVLIMLMTAVDERGKTIQLDAQRLVVAPQNAILARKILGTPLEVGNNNNTINVINKDGLIPDGSHVMTYLTNPKAWFIQTDAPYGFKSINRVDAERGSHGDFDTDNMLFKIYSRFGWGCSNWRAAYGSEGV